LFHYIRLAFQPVDLAFVRPDIRDEIFLAFPLQFPAADFFLDIRQFFLYFFEAIF
jgi:hypothetical protein